jgi:hypothetical protein
VSFFIQLKKRLKLYEYTSNKNKKKINRITHYLYETEKSENHSQSIEKQQINNKNITDEDFQSKLKESLKQKILLPKIVKIIMHLTYNLRLHLH